MSKKIFSTLLVFLFVVSFGTNCYASTTMVLNPDGGYGSMDSHFEKVTTDNGDVTLEIKNLSDVTTYLDIHIWEDDGRFITIENKKIRANDTLTITRYLGEGRIFAKSLIQNQGSEKVRLKVDFID
ncbi:PDDEXK-like family protein [Vallitalea guaymasensis]|uniref:Uncharacterized protein n=1 Tax=Vallitalea guaymasensis TaxID=1185412 RepID=A0A8J8MAF9_9FIRM|nr:hypothetical protein [Vallitalea guaymasensis]QUH29322.1 hypothetical protein HYG85_10440 [Vallitalea guaymasensis]